MDTAKKLPVEPRPALYHAGPTIEQKNEEIDRLRADVARLTQERDEAREQVPQSWEGDGGLGAMHSLAWYFRENGHWNAYYHIRAAAHHQGWCIDDCGTDQMVLDQGICPLCGYGTATPSVSMFDPTPAPTPTPEQP